jgi:hypothetical protein
VSRHTSGKDYRVSPLSRSCQLDALILASSHLDCIVCPFEALAGPDRRSQRQHEPKWTSRTITTRMRLAQAQCQAQPNARQTCRWSVYLTLARAALRAVRLSPSAAFQAGIPYLSWIALAAA